MKKIRKYVSTILSVVLVCAIFVNDGASLRVWASNYDSGNKGILGSTENPGSGESGSVTSEEPPSEEEPDEGEEEPIKAPVEEPDEGEELPTKAPAEEPDGGEEEPIKAPVEEPDEGEELPTKAPAEESDGGEEEPAKAPIDEPDEGKTPIQTPTEEPGEGEEPTKAPADQPAGEAPTPVPSALPTGEPDGTSPTQAPAQTPTPSGENPEEDKEHVHCWVREEGSIFPVCTECGEEYRDADCDQEEGIGVHIFELIQEEGQKEQYRCIICGYEKDLLEEWDLTVEMYLQMAEVTAYSYTYGEETSNIPVSVQELEAEVNRGQYKDQTFLVKNLADLMALQELSRDGFDFKDWTIQFIGRVYVSDQGDSTLWDLTSMTDYEGLGTADAPFRGTIKTYYTNNSLRFIANKPLLNYVSAGAAVSDFQIEAAINENSENPAGIIAAHAVPDQYRSADDPDGVPKVRLSNLRLSGQVTGQGAAGILFGEVTGDGGQQMTIDYTAADKLELLAGVNGKYAGGIAGKANGNVALYQTDLVPSASAVITGSLAAGMLVGGMASARGEDGSITGGRLYIDGAGGTVAANVRGSGNSGGLVGVIESGEILRTAGDGMLTVSGSVAGDTAAGGVVGKCADTVVNLENITVSAAVSSKAESGIAGGLLGKFETDKTGDLSKAFNLIHHVTMTGTVQKAGRAGGIIGEIDGSNLKIGSPDEDGICVSVAGSVIGNSSAGGASAGGIAGTAKGQYIEVYHAQVTGALQKSPSIGGIFGTAGDGDDTDRSRTVVKVTDVSVRSGVNPDADGRALGGIFGTVNRNCMAALDGMTDVSGFYHTNAYTSDYMGFIAGRQSEALIYFEDEEACTNYQKADDRAWVDDIGSYGGVYLNHSWGENSPLISYTEKKVTGTVEWDGGTGKLDSEADMIRLAIALNTQGVFEDGCFSGTGKADLLKGTYHLQEKLYDLEKSGVYSLNRNDEIGKNEKFTGGLIGSGNTVIRLGGLNTYQSYIALFPSAGEGAVFESFKLEGDGGGARVISRAKKGAAGLAVYGFDNIRVENVEINAAVTGNSADNASYLYGGMFADYIAYEGTALTVRNCKLEGSITIDKEATATEGHKHYSGGMIAKYTGNGSSTIEIEGLALNQKITSTSYFTSGMITQINKENTNTDKTILKMSDITVQSGAALVVTDTQRTGSSDELAAGGFLGRWWFDVTPYQDGNESYSVKGLRVGEAGEAAVPSYFATGTLGGMIHTVTGRIQLADTVINGINITGGNTGNDGLLINNGYDALIEIDGYSIPDKSRVSVTNVRAFSEIVGRNVGTGIRDNQYSEYVSGGIVNMISAGFAGASEAYQNQALDEGLVSGRVRYYYNLFGDSLSGESTFLSGNKLSGTGIVITNAEQMLIWHLNQYMNESIRKRYLAPYFDGEVPDKNTDVTLQGNISLENKSYYPTPVGNMTIDGAGAEINFRAEEITADSGRRPSAQGEHYMMQSGLLLGRTGKVTVQGGAAGYLTLSGTVSDAADESGALFSMEISGEKNIYRIKLKNLYIHGFGADDEHSHGLLIGKINDASNVDISWIETDYSNPNGRKAADALIGVVGHPDTDSSIGACKIVIDFTNMKLEDGAGTGGIFKNATFIDQYYYTDDTERNQGRVRYLFTKEASRGSGGDEYPPFTAGSVYGDNIYSAPYLTIGKELKDGVEYWNIDEYNAADDLVTDGSWEDYLPYVCKAVHGENSGKEIEVNPKNKDILDGCGTYEDPYQISSGKQLLALSRYLTHENDNYLEGWKVNRIGSQVSGFCDKAEGNHKEEEYRYFGGKQTNPDFPTQEELRQAYYQITKDIDLSNLATSTDRSIAQEFVGLGTEAVPFSGVIIGRKTDENGSGLADSIPAITLPNKKKNNNVKNFGLIQYAKGAVVKDVVIVCCEDAAVTDAALTNVIRVKENAGAAIACVLGGDNIIDNVTVRNKAAVSVNNTSAAVGGYVGSVRQGSVILKNMGEDKLADFESGTYNVLTGKIISFTETDLKKYPYISGVIGKVENGFVMYEGNGDGKIVLPHEAKLVSGIYRHPVLPLSKTYDIIALSGMEEALNDPMNIVQGADGNFSCEIKTAKQLQLVSMAINSDAFSVYYDGGGYDKYAVCRKAEYTKVGLNGLTPVDNDYKAAVGKDDQVYWYPYIYDYFTFNGLRASGSDRSAGTGFYSTLDSYQTDGREDFRSKLNAVTGDVSAKMSYSLVNDANYPDAGHVDYDLSDYGRAFRGLGAAYRIFDRDSETVSLNVKDEFYSDFRADFNGNGATVKARMINDYNREIHTAALFNDLIDTRAKNIYTIQNLIVTGKFLNYGKDFEFNTSAGTDNQNYGGDRAAAVVGMMRRPWILDNITVLDAEIASKGHAAGIVAWINPGQENTAVGGADYNSYALTNCKLKGTSAVTTDGGSCGGIVGVMTPASDGSIMDKGLKLTMEGCQVIGTSESDRVKIINNGNQLLSAYSQDQERDAKGRTGGLIGHVGNRKHTSGYGTKVNVKLEITGSASDLCVQYAAVDGVNCTGGILGEYYGFRDSSTTEQKPDVKMENVTVSDSLITAKGRNEYQFCSFGVGGIVGRIGRFSDAAINDSRVLNSDIKSVYAGNGTDTNSGTGYDLHAGGAVGYCYSMTDISLTHIVIEGKTNASGDPVNEISSRLLDAGGLIGRCETRPAVYNGFTPRRLTSASITSCQVLNMKIASDNRSDADKKTDKASGTSGGRAGGMIGTADRANIKVLMDGQQNDNVIGNCIVRVGKNNAGGVLGAVTVSDSNPAPAGNPVMNYEIEGVRVIGCTIGHNAQLKGIDSASGAGGIIGKIYSTYTFGTLRRIKVDSCDIFGRNTGGLMGYAVNAGRLGNIYREEADRILISGNNLLGYFAGGAIGWNNNAGSTNTCFEHVTVENNHILAVRNENKGASYAAAGGFCGIQTLRSANNHYNQISISGNQIMSCNSASKTMNFAGGMFGFFEGGNGYQVYAYEDEIRDNHIGYYDFASANQGKDTDAYLGNIEQQPAVVMSLVKKLGTDADNSAKLLDADQNNAVVSSMDAIAKDRFYSYAGYFGNILGGYSGQDTGFHAYFIKPAAAYTDSYAGMRPVVDAGYTAAMKGTPGKELLDSPYGYRRNIHVIYHEPDTSSNAAANIWKKGTGYLSGSGEELFFSQINFEDIFDSYRNAKSLTELLDAYRLDLHLKDDTDDPLETTYSQVYKNAGGYLSNLQVSVDGKAADLPMIVLDAQYGNADELLRGVLAVLTGSGGIQNSRQTDAIYDAGLSTVADIEIKSMKIANGAVSEDGGREKSLKAVKTNNRWEFSYTNKFDEINEDNPAVGTFTMLTVTYGQRGTYTAADGSSRAGERVVIRIPVFVIERLTIDTHVKIAEGAVYNVEKAKAEGTCTNPMLAFDSSYTIYSEYIYGSTRKKFSKDTDELSIEKTVGITNYNNATKQEENVRFWVGTRFTLIDVCDSNKVYYYEVTENTPLDKPIRYSDFKDAAGDPYENKPIHLDTRMEIHNQDDPFVTQDADYENGTWTEADPPAAYTDVAVERFLIIVDTSRVTKEAMEGVDAGGDVVRYRITPEIPVKMKTRTTLTEHTYLQVTRQEGLDIKLLNDKVQVDGKIDKDETLTVIGQFETSASEAYWERALNKSTTTIDSANHGKYLELGLYLEQDGKRIPLPDNTNVMVKGVRESPILEAEQNLGILPEQNLGAYVNESAVYLYKDGKIEFPLDELKNLIAQEKAEKNDYTDGKVVMDFKIELNFENADLTDYVENSAVPYVLHLELLRAEEPDYPADGEVIGEFVKQCSGARQSEIACALEASALEQLGINTYNNQAKEQEIIDFKFKLDFNGVWSKNRETNERTAAKYYTVTYRILEKKIKDGQKVYEPYTGDDLAIELVDNRDSVTGSEQILRKGKSSRGDEKNSVYVDYKFALDEIEAGTEGQEKVITRDVRLKVADAADMDLTNYKIQASVMISDNGLGDIDSEVNKALSDFFVFTIAKLKTDLDY